MSRPLTHLTAGQELVYGGDRVAVVPPELAEALWRQMIGWFVQYEEEKLRQSMDGKE